MPAAGAQPPRDRQHFCRRLYRHGSPAPHRCTHCWLWADWHGSSCRSSHPLGKLVCCSPALKQDVGRGRQKRERRQCPAVIGPKALPPGSGQPVFGPAGHQARGWQVKGGSDPLATRTKPDSVAVEHQVCKFLISHQAAFRPIGLASGMLRWLGFFTWGVCECRFIPQGAPFLLSVCQACLILYCCGIPHVNVVWGGEERRYKCKVMRNRKASAASFWSSAF